MPQRVNEALPGLRRSGLLHTVCPGVHLAQLLITALSPAGTGTGLRCLALGLAAPEGPPGSRRQPASAVIYGRRVRGVTEHAPTLQSFAGESVVRQSEQNLLSGLVVAFAMIPEDRFPASQAWIPRSGCSGVLSPSPSRWWAVHTDHRPSTACDDRPVATGEARGAGLGVQYLMVAGLLTGVLQFLWAYLRLAYQMRFVPQGVLSGFVNALALLIFQAQLPSSGLISSQ